MTIDVNRRYIQPSKANRLVSGELEKGGVQQQAEPISQGGMRHPLTIWTIPAYYDLAQAENRVLIEWLLPLSEHGLASRLLRLMGVRLDDPPRSLKDVRYLLAEALLDPLVRANFDLVIIDSPPRLTPSHIQAMCASTHLLVPTILDGLAGDAVARYLDQVATHKLGPPGNASRAICPDLQPIGVVCTLLPPGNADLTGRLNVLRGRIAAARLNPDIVPQDCFIRQRSPYRDHAGERIAYAATPRDQVHRDLRDEVDRLGDWIAPKIGAEARGWSRREA
jgi:chromosome partitioning protein